VIRVAVIGYGYWGPNLVRNFNQTDGAAVVAVCDRSDERRWAVERLYPAVRTYAEVDDVLAAQDVDAVAIATPVSTHFDLAMRALAAGKHVLVEKPMTSTVAEAETLVAEADDRGLTLMVDHTFVYTSAVRKIRDLITDGGLGELYYYDSVRVNLGLFQHDVSVLWDLAVHDLSIMDFLLDRTPTHVSAVGMSHVHGEPINMAYLTCHFDDRLIAHFHVNWLAPVKVRQTMICGSERMVVFDDIETSEKVKVYDKGIIVGDRRADLVERHVGYRTGDMWAPRLDTVEALGVEAAHFVDCVTNGTRPCTDGQAGLRVVRILEAATKSLADRGTPVDVAS
jgi:predicted dehydrogenase